MMALARSVPDEWSQHEKIGDTPQGWALHAMVLDIDVGPMLQTHKLLTSVQFARTKGYDRPLTRGRARDDEPDRRQHRPRHGDDAVRRCASRCRPRISSSARGYERNPVASRNNTVAKLLAVTDARMDSQQQPARREGIGGGVLDLSSSGPSERALRARSPGPISTAAACSNSRMLRARSRTASQWRSRLSPGRRAQLNSSRT